MYKKVENEAHLKWGAQPGFDVRARQEIMLVYSRGWGLGIIKYEALQRGVRLNKRLI